LTIFKVDCIVSTSKRNIGRIKMAIYFENRINKETGNKAFKRAIVRNIDGLFYGMFEKDYGYGEMTSVKITKGYKTEKGADKAVESWVNSRPNGNAVYNKMASSHWSK